MDDFAVQQACIDAYVAGAGASQDELAYGAVLVLGGSIAGHTQTATTFIHDAIEERDLASAYGMAAVLALASIALLLVLEVLKRRTHAVTRREK